ncbi:hypothetical protein QTP70_007142 [Hemibagrus guttatus]|uniref:LIM zinc-binding domain-containing protein n=1 Tax=Hemibagrus guttatus TaxID=175788 RepID=A0AAE0RHJ0_9TELE|nr:hypothetical protein QTP70_007142 [Hemibagrus guttatus]KAK3574185.1 hypothetical protein QTP86_004412 [Hemibagrus guttatus]
MYPSKTQQSLKPGMSPSQASGDTQMRRNALLQDNSWIKKDREDEPEEEVPNYGRDVLGSLKTWKSTERGGLAGVFWIIVLLQNPSSLQLEITDLQIYQSGKGYKAISKALGLLRTTVRAIIYKWRKHGTVENLPRSGRPTKITPRAQRQLIQEVTKDPTTTSKELQASLASVKENFSYNPIKQFYSSGVLRINPVKMSMDEKDELLPAYKEVPDGKTAGPTVSLSSHVSQTLHSTINPTPVPSKTSRIISKRDLCTFCAKSIIEGERIILDDFQIFSHTFCFKCDMCYHALGNLEAGDSLWVHKGRVICANCYIKTKDQWYR